jgi:hypothetical protein
MPIIYVEEQAEEAPRVFNHRGTSSRKAKDDGGRPVSVDEGMQATLATYERRNNRGMRYQRGRTFVITENDGSAIPAENLKEADK